jgi:hypothetical protein
LTARRRGWRAVARKVGATLGTLALLLQCLAFVGIQPAKAAPLPFNDPAAWCGMPDMAPVAPDDGSTPLHRGMLCPVCQTVQAAGSGLLPPTLVIVAPAVIELAPLAAAKRATPLSPDRSSASPRGPPRSL